MSKDALMRWEWEGGAPDSVSEGTRAEPPEKSDVRPHEVDQVDDPAEPGPAHV